MTTTPLYQALSRSLDARQNCLKSNNLKWAEEHEERISKLLKEHMPSGSGFDAKIELDLNIADKLVFFGSFHVMEEGIYTKWVDFTVTVTADLSWGYNIEAESDDMDDLSGYIADVFAEVLEKQVPLYS